MQDSRETQQMLYKADLTIALYVNVYKKGTLR